MFWTEGNLKIFIEYIFVKNVKKNLLENFKIYTKIFWFSKILCVVDYLLVENSSSLSNCKAYWTWLMSDACVVRFIITLMNRRALEL